MKIAVCGQGFVGRAVSASLKHFHDLVGIDPKLGSQTVRDIEDVDCVIVCVPTPQGPKGECDVSYIAQVLDTVQDNTPTLIKSTTSISGWTSIVRQFPRHELTFSPEFLRQDTSIEDFANSRDMYFGGSGRCVEFWIDRIFLPVFPNCNYHHVSVEEAILIKYFRNSFLATKVIWFNEAKRIAEQEGCDWESVRKGVAGDSRIGDSHSHVSEAGGYGGACFPKDVQALLYDYEHSLVKRAHEWNQHNREEDQ